MSGVQTSTVEGETAEKTISDGWQKLKELAEGLAVTIDVAQQVWLAAPESPEDSDADCEAAEAAAVTLREVAAQLNVLADKLGIESQRGRSAATTHRSGQSKRLNHEF
jgi:hypothetical protein